MAKKKTTKKALVKHGHDNHTSVNVVFKNELIEQLDKIAEQEMLNRAIVVRKLVAAGVERFFSDGKF